MRCAGRLGTCRLGEVRAWGLGSFWFQAGCWLATGSQLAKPGWTDAFPSTRLSPLVPLPHANGPLVSPKAAVPSPLLTRTTASPGSTCSPVAPRPSGSIGVPANERPWTNPLPPRRLAAPRRCSAENRGGVEMRRAVDSAPSQQQPRPNAQLRSLQPSHCSTAERCGRLRLLPATVGRGDPARGERVPPGTRVFPQCCARARQKPPALP